MLGHGEGFTLTYYRPDDRSAGDINGLAIVDDEVIDGMHPRAKIEDGFPWWNFQVRELVRSRPEEEDIGIFGGRRRDLDRVCEDVQGLNELIIYLQGKDSRLRHNKPHGITLDGKRSGGSRNG